MVALFVSYRVTNRQPERDRGTLRKYLVRPRPSASVVLGKGLSAGIRGLMQALMISIIAIMMGVHLMWNPLAWVGAMAFLLMGAVFFSSLSLFIAAMVRTRERVQGLGRLILMPRFFASNALYPIDVIPSYVAIIASFNPLSYMIDGLRGLMVEDAPWHYTLPIDFAVLAVANVVMVVQ